MGIALATSNDRHGWTGDRIVLARTLRALSRDVGADRVIAGRRSPGVKGPAIEILASDWPFDAVMELGAATVAACLDADGCAAPGQAATLRMIDVTEGEPAYAVAHRYELSGSEYAVVYSARSPSGFHADRAVTVQMRAYYALAEHCPAAPTTEDGPVLSHRERDCLKWVAEGKTTDEIALILGVSPNTVNNYIAHAIPKVSATNRAMAVANAIRCGMI